jgi:RNA polymerase sigma factor (sigma-70 family)
MTAFDSLPLTKLSSDREQELAKLRTEEAAAELALYSTREAVVYTRRCCRGHLEVDVLISVCYEVLIKIARRFKPGQQRFFAFAKAGLRGAVKDYYRTLDVVRNAKTVTRGQVAFEKSCETPRRIDSDELAGFSTNHRRWHSGDDKAIICIEAATGEIAEPDFDSVHFRERWALVSPIIEDKCSDLEKTVLTLLYTGGFNFPEIGGMLDISRQAVQAIQSRALKKVRNELLRRKRLLNQD